jgi:hypothetical protein
MDDERRNAFSMAFIAQARSDFRVYRHLAERPEFAVCHALHYLQMATEKLAKAYRLRDTKSPVDELVSKHTGFAKFIGPFFTATLKDEYRGRDAQLVLLSKTFPLTRFRAKGRYGPGFGRSRHHPTPAVLWPYWYTPEGL